MAIVHFPLKLTARRMIAPSVAHLSFLRDDGQPLDYIPGQFIQVHFAYADGTAARRSYSLATQHDHALAPGEAVEIAVSYVPGGAATALFEGLPIGGSVDASGPFGRFCLLPNDANRRYLLIATGTGVTPYRSMLPELERQIVERPADGSGRARLGDGRVEVVEAYPGQQDGGHSASLEDFFRERKEVF